MIKAQLKNLIKTIHLVKEAGFSLLVFSIAISLFQGILPIFSMLLVQKMLNIITTDIKNFHTLMIAFISYIALTLLTIIIGEVDSYIDTKLQILLHYKMNHLVMQKTVKLTLAEFETPEIYGKFHFTTIDGKNELKFTMNNMLNSDSQSRVLRLLVDLSEFEYGLSHWSLFPWDILAQERVYIPEILFEDITIATAQWNLSVIREEIIHQKIFTGKKDIFNKFRKTYKIPKDIILKYADNELRLDLSIDSDLEILFKNINKYRFVSLRGIEQGESIFKDNLGNYNTEIVVPILKESNGINNTNDNVQFKNEVKKIYLPFCDWLFFKFYGPKERQEELLNNWKKFWLNLPSELFSQSNMFYMRYNDTNDHIRIRINCDSIENNFSLYLSVVQDLLPQLIESCIISDIEVSSYKPEVNRYRGPHLISYAEEIFCKESILFLNNTIEFSDDERLVCATYLVLYYLNHFFKDKETRRSFLFENYTGKYKKDFKNLPIDLPIEYMKILNGVTSALDRYDFFQEMDRYPMSYMKEYNRFGGTNDIYNTKFNLVGSFLHLSMNRLNGIDREFEEKVYCFAYYTLNAQQYIEWE